MRSKARTAGVCIFTFLVSSVSTAFIFRVARPQLRDYFAARPQFQDFVDHMELEMDLRHPPTFSGNAVLRLRKGSQGIFPFILNQKLDVEEITDGSGQTLEFEDLGRLRSPYFKESRALEVRLPSNTQEIRIRYSGRGYDGSEKKDWMGILLVANDELRMSKQSAFYPQVPNSLEGPSPRSWPGRIHAIVPESFEAHAPGNSIPPRDSPSGSRAWSWESTSPTVYSFFAARRVRQEIQLGQVSVLTLMTAQHAHFGASLATQAEKMLSYYTKTWGSVGRNRLGIVEMVSRGDSYNWASPGIVVMESGAIANDAGMESLAHEISHLWWGNPRGPAERFLTESLAEYGSWRFVQDTSGDSAAHALALEAEQHWWQSVHETGEDPSVLDFGFHAKGYQALAYAKGPAFLWRLQQTVGVLRMDEALRSYCRELRDRTDEPDSSKLLLQALREHAADPSGTDLALLQRAGHFHFALEESSFEGNKVRGSVSSLPCPRDIPAPKLEKLPLQIFLESSELFREISLESGEKTRFEIECPSEPIALRFDPFGSLPRRESITALRPGMGFLRSDPPHGARDLPLGPLTFRMHFGSKMQEPEASFRRSIGTRTEALAKEARAHGVSVLSFKIQDDRQTFLIEIEDTIPERDHVLAIPEGLVTTQGIPIPEFSLRFRTRSAQGFARPWIVSTEPANGAKAVPVNLAQLKIVFSEPMRSGRGFRRQWNAELKEKGWNFPTFTSSHWEDSKTLVWTLREPLEKGTRYGLPFDELYLSKLGLPLGRFDLCFETEP